MSSGLMACSVDLDRISSAYTRGECELHGIFLDNRPFSPVRYWWFEEVDAVPRKLGATAVRMDDLRMGEESGEEWGTNAVRMAASQAAEVTPEQVDALEDHSMRESVHTVLEWVRVAAERNHGIVGFYH